MKKSVNFLFLFVIMGFFQPEDANGFSSVSANEFPKGRIETFRFDQSKIYPGTYRSVTVYIPQQLNPAIPACIYVSQDGFSQQLSDAMDTLIARREMPVTVGIFVSPGHMIFPLEPGSERDNRPFEYNSLGDRYARLLTEEIIPLVTGKYKLNLSDDPNDRCIGGCSSGGICAFNAAWERPDAFRRVYCSSGSFVAYAGGNILPVLIRKCEPKPIRVFLHGAKKDLNNVGGNFWLTYETIKDALAFSGYDFNVKESEGGHCESYLTVFSEAMRWLWSDYPNQVKKASGSAYFNSIISPDEGWIRLNAAYKNIRCLTVNSDGAVYFCDLSDNRLYKLDTNGKLSLFSSDARHVNGLTAAYDGFIYGISDKTRKLWAFNTEGKSSIVAGKIPGSVIKALPDGGFFTAGEVKGIGKIWHISKNGKVQIADTGLQSPAGLAILNNKILLVPDSGSHWVYSYLIGNKDSLLFRENTVWLHVPDNCGNSGANSIGIDSGGRIFVSTRMGIWVGKDQPYETQSIVSLPSQKITGLVTGGETFNELYVSDGNFIYKRKLKANNIKTR